MARGIAGKEEKSKNTTDPDEIEEMIEANDIEYEDHIADYEEQFVKQHNHSDEALNDDAEEILLNSDPISRLNLGDE